MLFNEKTCFTVFNKRNYDDMFCYVVSAAEGIEPGLVCLVESGIAALCIAAYT